MRKIIFLGSRLLALLSVIAVVAAAGLTKLGHPWLGVALMLALCIFGMVIERPVTARRAGRS
jgi:hypothetical protein